MPEITIKNGIPQCTIEHFERDFADRHLLHGVLRKWALLKPHALAIINAETGDEATWEKFDSTTTALALKLLKMGFKKGDFFASLLPLLTEHIFLEYACFKIGVIFVPLDFSLKTPEVIRSLNILKVKGFGFLGKCSQADFSELGEEVMEECPSIEHFVQFSPLEETIDGAISVYTLLNEALIFSRELARSAGNMWFAAFGEISGSISEEDGALVLFTGGANSNGKAALLTHRNITSQNMCLGTAFNINSNSRVLVNLPPSDVGCQTGQLMTTFFMGGTAVILPIFDAKNSLDAIEKYKVDCLWQRPVLYEMQWGLPDYDKYDLSSLKCALFTGRQISRQFLEKIATMANGSGSGLELTESAGFCTYTPLNGTVNDLLTGAGYDMPVYLMSIRKPMKENGFAGEELPDGECGHICFRGPQTFRGYLNDIEATEKRISKDGWLYTGLTGYQDKKGLHLTSE